MIDLKKIRHIDRLIFYYHVVNGGSISKTALRLGISISAVSKHISDLENEAGAKLLIRSKGKQGVELTEVGRKFFLSSSNIIHELEHMYEQVTPSDFLSKKSL